MEASGSCASITPGGSFLVSPQSSFSQCRGSIGRPDARALSATSRIASAQAYPSRLGGVTAIVSFRPGGRMQQSAVPRCAILSDGSTGGIRL